MSLQEELAASWNPRVAEVLAEVTRTAPYPSLLGLVVAEQRAGFIRCRLPVVEKLQNGVGLVHGGALVSLIDHVLSVVVYPHVEPGKWVATLDLKVSYIAPVRGGVLVADAEITSLRRTIGTARIEVRNEVDGEETLIATAMGTVFVKEKPKPEESR